MKRRGLLLALACFIAAGGWALDVNGELSTETRLSLDDGRFLFNQENAGLAFEQQVDDNLYCKVKLHARYFNDPIGSQSMSNILTSRELGVLSSVYPVEIDLEEAYLTCTGFIFSGLDLTVGKQRIAWGTADRLNPTDLLNPLDFSDPLDFGRKTPSVALNLTYTLPALDSFIQVVYEPYSQVALLNPAMIQSLSQKLYAGTTAGFVDAIPGWESETAQAPQYDFRSYALGAKVGASIAGFDLSANYVTRINDMPSVKEVDLFVTPGLPPLTLNSNSYTLAYYREQEVGFDLAKDFAVVLAWAEVGVFFPEKQTTSIKTYDNASQALLNETIATAVSDQPYAKYTVGISQKIGGIFYFNLQYNHGFFNERGNTGSERLQDYALLRLEVSLLSDKLTLGATGMANVNNISDAFSSSDIGGYISNNYGVMGGLDIQYLPSLNMTLKLGVMIFQGTASTTLGAWKQNRVVYLAFDSKF